MIAIADLNYLRLSAAILLFRKFLPKVISSYWRQALSRCMEAATAGAAYQVGETTWGALVISANLFAECAGENFGAVDSAVADNPSGVDRGTFGRPIR